mgnify:CR=1
MLKMRLYTVIGFGKGFYLYSLSLASAAPYNINKTILPHRPISYKSYHKESNLILATRKIRTAPPLLWYDWIKNKQIDRARTFKNLNV